MDMLMVIGAVVLYGIFVCIVSMFMGANKCSHSCNQGRSCTCCDK